MLTRKEILTLEKVKLECLYDEDKLAIYVMTMTAGENWFTLEMNNELHKCLDMFESELAQTPGHLRVALMITGTGKFFSLGLSLKSYYREGENPQRLFERTYQRVILRVLGMPVITIAAINGHAIAGGMVLALACDYRIMNKKKGFMAMNEIQLPSSIPSGMLAVIKLRIKDPQLLRDCLLLGDKYTNEEMNKFGIIDRLSDDVYNEAIEMVTKLAHRNGRAPFVSLIKKFTYKEAFKELSEAEAFDHFTNTTRIMKSAPNSKL